MEKKKIIRILSLVLLALFFAVGILSLRKDSSNGNEQAGYPITKESVTQETTQQTTEATTQETTGLLDEFVDYTSKEDVALYLYTYGHLPQNFITKNEAKALGWSGGGLDPYRQNACIGGDKFGNFEENLPKKSGRQYYECDIDTMNQNSRGAKRIVYSNDGLIYYTSDHYSTFELLYENAKID